MAVQKYVNNYNANKLYTSIKDFIFFIIIVIMAM